MPARGFAAGPFRSTIAACLLLPGHPGRATGTAITALHGYRSALATGAVLRALADGGHDTVLTAISCLAGYLDTSGSPIDYQRRRDLIPAETITAGQWRDLCYGAAAHPGEMEHPGFGGDSILPRCSGLGGCCLPRYRRMAEPRSDHFSAFVLSNICPAALSSCPAWWRAPPGQAAPGGLGISSSGTRFAPRVPRAGQG